MALTKPIHKEEMLGVIRDIRIGRVCGRSDEQMGVIFNLGTDTWGTSLQYTGNEWDTHLELLMVHAKVKDVGALIGKPVRVYFENTWAKRFEILKDCVL